MKHLLTLVVCSFAFAARANDNTTPNPNNEQLIFVMPEDRGYQLVDQCTRTSYYPDSFWRVTEEQIQAIELLLTREIHKLEESGAEFVPDKLDNYKRQYVGFKLEGKSYYYGNFFPKNHNPRVDPKKRGVVLCRGDKRFWGMVFEIDDFKFTAIERNNKMIKPQGVYDPSQFKPFVPSAEEDALDDEDLVDENLKE